MRTFLCTFVLIVFKMQCQIIISTTLSNLLEIDLKYLHIFIASFPVAVPVSMTLFRSSADRYRLTVEQSLQHEWVHRMGFRRPSLSSNHLGVVPHNLSWPHTASLRSMTHLCHYCIIHRLLYTE